MTDDKYGMYRRRTFDDILNEVLTNPFNGLLGRSLATEPLDRKKEDGIEEDEERREASENYRTLQTLGFIKGLYRAAYDNLCLAERTMIPFSEYMKSEDVLKYQLLEGKVLDLLDELSDLLEVFDDTMAKTLDVWNKEEE